MTWLDSVPGIRYLRNAAGTLLARRSELRAGAGVDFVDVDGVSELRSTGALPANPGDDGTVAIANAGVIAWTPPANPLALLHGDPGGGGTWVADVPPALQYGYDGSTSQRVSGDAVQVIATTNATPASVTVATLALNETLHIVVLVVASGGGAPGSEVWTCKAGLRGTGAAPPALMYSSVTSEGGVDVAAWLDPVWDLSANATAKLTLTGVAATNVEWTVAPQVLRTRPYDGT